MNLSHRSQRFYYICVLYSNLKILKAVVLIHTPCVPLILTFQDHYYQPIWTLVGGGVKPFSSSAHKTQAILPSQCDWIKDRAVQFDPEKCTVTTSDGKEVISVYRTDILSLILLQDTTSD